MAHTKEYTELAVQIGKLMERAEDLKRDNGSLRSAIAEKTAQVERLREALDDLVDMCETEFTFGGPPACDFDLMVLPSAREALAATAPSAPEAST